MSDKMKAYRINMITPEDVANGAKKGAIVYLHGTHPDDSSVYLFVDKPGDAEGIPLYMQQVARVPEFDRASDEYILSGAKKIEELEPALDDGLSRWEREEITDAMNDPDVDTSTGDDARFAEDSPPPPVVETAYGLSVVDETKPDVDALLSSIGEQVSRGAGLKYDTGKPQPRLLFEGVPLALEEVVRTLTFGAKKYAPHSWQNVENGEERYQDASYRHDMARCKGELLDPETGIRHRAHHIINELFLLEKELRAEA